MFEEKNGGTDFMFANTTNDSVLKIITFLSSKNISWALNFKIIY